MTPPPALACDPEDGQGVVHVSVPRAGVRCRCRRQCRHFESRRAAYWRAGSCAGSEASKRLHDSPLRTRNMGAQTCGQPRRDHREQVALSAAGNSGCRHRSPHRAGIGERSVLHACAGRWEPQRRMDDRPDKRLTGHELDALFERLFPHGFAGADVLAEIAPEGWQRSPLPACFHPSLSSCSRNEWRSTATWKSGVVSRTGARAQLRLEPRHRGLSRRLTTCAASTNRRQ